MTIKIKDLPFYYMSCEARKSRLVKLQKLIDDLDVKSEMFFNTSNLPLRQSRISCGAIKLLDLIIEKNIFPCITIDDDVQLITDIPETLPIPDTSCVIVLGGSLHNTGKTPPNVYLKEYYDTYYRLYQGLSYHSMIIPKKTEAEVLKIFVDDSFRKNCALDRVFAHESDKFVFLTPKDGPYFYQDNYNEHVTRFLWKNVKDELLLK